LVRAPAKKGEEEMSNRMDATNVEIAKHVIDMITDELGHLDDRDFHMVMKIVWDSYCRAPWSVPPTDRDADEFANLHTADDVLAAIKRKFGEEAAAALAKAFERNAGHKEERK
jgi:hypothetical protein